MDALHELLKVDEKDALRFFYHSLRETSSAKRFGTDEALHVATVLAHYAQVSCTAPASNLTPPTNLSQILERFVILEQSINDPELLEIAGAQSLFLLGLFPTQMRHRHNLRWHLKLGVSFYRRAHLNCHLPKKRLLLGTMARHFVSWTLACQEMRINLYEKALMLRLD